MVPENQWDERTHTLTQDHQMRDRAASDPEKLFALVSGIACRWLGVPIALIGLTAGNRRWIKQGADGALNETGSGQSFTDQVVSQDSVLVCDDAAGDPRFRDDALVKGKAGIHAFAGVPFRAPDGQMIGALCVMDTKAHRFSDADRRMIDDLAAMLAAHFRPDDSANGTVNGLIKPVHAVQAAAVQFLQPVLDEAAPVFDLASSFTPDENEAGGYFNNILRGGVAHEAYSVALRRRGDWLRHFPENAPDGSEPGSSGTAKDHLAEPPPSEWADDLNVMFNRSRFMNLGDAEFNRCVRHDHCLALLIVRIDGLKHLSRHVGAGGADKILGALTTRWRRAIRDHDLLGRLGVETFGLLLPETDTERAAAVAARLRDATAKESVSASELNSDLDLEIGVSSLSSNHHCFDDIFSDAEMVLTNNLKSKQFSQSSVVA